MSEAPVTSDVWDEFRDQYDEDVQELVDAVKDRLRVRDLIAINLAECVRLQKALRQMRPGKSFAAVQGVALQRAKLLAKLVAGEGPTNPNDEPVDVPEGVLKLLREFDVDTVDVGDEVLATPDPNEIPERYRKG